MSEIKIKDLFDELYEENQRLITELMFANKCLNVLNKFKSFVDLIIDKIKTNLDPNLIKIYDDLLKETEEVSHSVNSLEDKQLVTKVVNDIFFDKNSIHEIIEVNPDIITSDQSMDQTNDSLDPNPRSDSPINNSINDLISNERKAIFSNTIRLKSALNKRNQSGGQSLDLKNSSDNRQEFKCCFVGCEKVFPTKQKLIGHQRRCHSGAWFTCDESGCEYKTRTKALIKFHEKSHTMPENTDKGQSFICGFPGCGHQFTNSGDLKRHLSNHKVIKRFVCDYESCNKNFMTKTLLKVHIKESHLSSEQSFKCDFKSCLQIFNSYELLAKHKSTHIVDKPFHCEEPNCEYRAKKLTALKYHNRIAHKTDRPFNCEFEGCLFASKTNGVLKVHIKTVHFNERSYVCDRTGCGKTFKTQGGLSSHCRNFHSELLFDCNWPGCQFFTKSEMSLKSHKRNHENERQYACDWNGCQKRFNFKHQLTIHMRTHTQEKRYACQWPGCHYRCIFGGNLTKHMRVHQKVKLDSN